jgi:O-antigen ligase
MKILYQLEPYLFVVLLGAPFISIVGVSFGVALAWFFFLVHLFRGELTLRRPWVYGYLLYFLSLFLSTLLSPDPSLSFRYLLKEWRVGVLFWSATGIFFSAVQRGFPWVVFAMGFSLLGGIVDLLPIEIPSWLIPQPSNPDPNRSASFLKMATTLGGVSMLGLFLPFLFPLSPILRTVTFLFAFLLLLISGTRGAWAGALLGIWITLKGKGIPLRHLIVFSLLFANFLIVFPPTRKRLEILRQGVSHETSLTQRFILYRYAWEMGHKTVLGVGPGRFTPIAKEMAEKDGNTKNLRTYVHAHNLFLHTLAEGGWITLLSLLIFLGTLFYSFLKGSEEGRWIGVGVLTAFLIEGLTELNLRDGEVACIFYFLLGSILYLSQKGLKKEIRNGEKGL